MESDLTSPLPSVPALPLSCPLDIYGLLGQKARRMIHRRKWREANMGKRVAVGLLGLAGLALVCFSGGCGTVCNLAGGFIHPDAAPKVYGGMQIDLEGFQELMDDHWSMTKSTSSGQSTAWMAIAVLGFMAAEPALTFVGDTLTLPIALLAEHFRKARKSGEEEAKVAGEGGQPVTLGRPELTGSPPAESRESFENPDAVPSKGK